MPRPRLQRPAAAGFARRSEDEDSHQPGQVPEEQDRRARKRATDRMAQQEHRKRQKLYVEQLEAKVQFLMKHSSSNDFTALIRENEALRSEVRRLQGFFDGVRGLVQAQGDSGIALTDEASNHNKQQPDPSTSLNCSLDDMLDAVASDLTPSHSSLDAQGQDEMSGLFDHTNSASDTGTAVHDVTNSVDVSEMIQSQQVSDPVHLVEDDHLQRQKVSHWPNFDVQDLRVPWHLRVSKGPSTLDFNSACPEMVPFYTPFNFHQSSRVYGPAAAASAMESFRQGSHNLQPFLESRVSHWQHAQPFPLSPHYLCLPPLSEYTLTSDASFLQFLRLPEHEMRLAVGTKLPKPSVGDFLLNNSSNLLSSKIKSYIAPITKYSRIPETLASYWVITLFTRWYIQKDEESYNDMPTWLQPTELQRSMSHPMALWFMPWPELRDAAISVSLSQPAIVEDIMLSLGQFMEIDFSSASANATRKTADYPMNDVMGGDGLMAQILIRPDSTDFLDSAIKDLRNWKLQEGYFARYPQWRSLYTVARERLHATTFTADVFSTHTANHDLALYT